MGGHPASPLWTSEGPGPWEPMVWRPRPTAESFLAFVHLAAARLWLRFVQTA